MTKNQRRNSAVHVCVTSLNSRVVTNRLIQIDFFSQNLRSSCFEREVNYNDRIKDYYAQQDRCRLYTIEYITRDHAHNSYTKLNDLSERLKEKKRDLIKAEKRLRTTNSYQKVYAFSKQDDMNFKLSFELMIE